MASERRDDAPAVEDDDDVLRAPGRGDVPRPHPAVIVVVKPGEVGVPLSTGVQPRQAHVCAKVLPSAA